MTATTTAIKTERRDGEAMPIPLKANAVILQGTFALIDAAGFGISSSTAAAVTQTCLGVWEDSYDNTGGADGALVGVARRKKQFLFANLGADPVAQADLGATVYVADNQTIAKTHNTNTRPVAGKFMGFDQQYPTFVWVEV